MKEWQEVSLMQALRLINFGPLILVTAAYDNQRTIAPIAWVTPLSQNPTQVGVSVGVNHLTHYLINKSEEFAINIPGVNLLKAVAFCGSVSGEKQDKFLEAGLTPMTAKIIKTPLIEECLGHLECQVVERISVNDHTLFVGKVLAARLEKGLMKPEGVIDIKKAKTIHHLGGQHFAVLQDEVSIV